MQVEGVVEAVGCVVRMFRSRMRRGLLAESVSGASTGGAGGFEGIASQTWIVQTLEVVMMMMMSDGVEWQ